MTQDPTDVIRGAYEAFARGDVAAVLETMDPKVAWVESTAEGLPVRGTHVGPANVAQEVFATIPQSWSEFAVVPGAFFHDGDTVIATGRVKAVALSGRALDAPFVHVFTLSNGKIVRMTNHHDTALWLEALAP